MDIQQYMNNMMDAQKETRSNYHLTLGELSTALNNAPDDAVVIFDDGTPVGGADSYRGYYTDIALDDGENKTSVSNLRPQVAEWLNYTFIGYKGGEYPSTPDTPLWRSEYGSTSDMAIVTITVTDDTVTLITKHIVD